MRFNQWIDTFIAEKGFDLEHHVYEIEDDGPFGTNFISLESVVEFVKTLDLETKRKIKTTVVKIDFVNGDCHHFFKHIAWGMVSIAKTKGQETCL